MAQANTTRLLRTPRPVRLLPEEIEATTDFAEDGYLVFRDVVSKEKPVFLRGSSTNSSV
jgi:hypothetical protein